MELNNASIESKPTQALAEAIILNRREEKRRRKSLERNEKQALDESFDHKSSDGHTRLVASGGAVNRTLSSLMRTLLQSAEINATTLTTLRSSTLTHNMLVKA